MIMYHNIFRAFKPRTHIELIKRHFNHNLEPDHVAVQQLCKDFAKKHLVPYAASVDQTAKFPKDQIKLLGEMGMLSMAVSPKWNGSGRDMLSLSVAIEQISRGCASTGVIVAIHNSLYANLLNNRGSDEQKEQFLKPFTKAALGCFALSEPDAGSDVGNTQATARQDGDHWILNGTKSWVTSAIEGKASAVFATYDKGLKHKGISCFIVPLDTPGVTVGSNEPKMGVRGASSSCVYLQDVRIPNSYMIGEKGEGFKIAMTQLDQARIGIASHALGISQAALDCAIDYSTQRVAYGRPLADLSSVKVLEANTLKTTSLHLKKAQGSQNCIQQPIKCLGIIKFATRIAEMSLQVESLRLLTYRAAVEQSTKNSAMAKLAAGICATSVSDSCIQVLGGMGYASSMPAERHYRDAKGTQIYGGVTDVQKVVVANQVYREHGYHM